MGRPDNPQATEVTETSGEKKWRKKWRAGGGLGGGVLKKGY